MSEKSLHARAKRIQPLVWYTLGEYKVYFACIAKWYAKFFPRNGKPTKTPVVTFEGPDKKSLLIQIDDYCLENFGKTYRFRKLHQATESHQPKCSPYQKVVAPVKKATEEHKVLHDGFKDLNKKLLETYACVLNELKRTKTLSVIGVMLSALVVVMIMLLNIMK